MCSGAGQGAGVVLVGLAHVEHRAHRPRSRSAAPAVSTSVISALAAASRSRKFAIPESLPPRSGFIRVLETIRVSGARRPHFGHSDGVEHSDGSGRDDRRQQLADRAVEHGVGEAVHLGRAGVDDDDSGARRLRPRDAVGRRVDAAASTRRRAAGRTPRSPRSARSMTSGTSDWPNEIVSLLRIPPQTRHGGSSSPARTRSSASPIGRRSSQSQHRVHHIVPCTSMTARRRSPGLLVQAVDVLGDDGVQPALALKLDEGEVAGVGLGRPRRRRQPVPPRQPAHVRVGEVVLERRRLLRRRVLRPHALRTAEVGDARVRRDAGAGEHGDPLRLRHPPP